MSKRILWIFNHTTLRKWEVPLLIEMGYEVFCPKQYGVDFGDLSTSTTTEFDYTLTIPSEVLEFLNGIDFYKELDIETIDYINQYFHMVFCIVGREPLRSLLIGYKNGPIIVQCFGMMGSFSFANRMGEVYGHEMLSLIERVGSRFWFGAGYGNIPEIEPDCIRRRSIFMPVSFPFSEREKWVGGDNRILFVAPKIRTSVYYQEIYEKFNEELGDIPHVIGGAQLIPVTTDNSVAGFLSYNEYIYNMTHLSAMFYHSQEPRHIHYHPLEAIQRGMPLVFMAGGMLDDLGGIGLPGRCKNYKEARIKLKRLSNGDKFFARQLIKSQGVLLTKVSNDYCKNYWKKALSTIEKETNLRSNIKKKLAIVLPYVQDWILIGYVRGLVASIISTIKRNSLPIELVFAYSEQYHDFDDNICDISISKRPFREVERDKQWIKDVFEISGFEPKLMPLYKEEKVIELCDGMQDFGDCDYVIIANDIVKKNPIFLKTPHAILVHSFIDRYFDISESDESVSKTVNICSADKVIVYNESVYEDVCQLGVGKEKIIKISGEYNNLRLKKKSSRTDKSVSIIIQGIKGCVKKWEQFDNCLRKTGLIEQYNYIFIAPQEIDADLGLELDLIIHDSDNCIMVREWNDLCIALENTSYVVIADHTKYERVIINELVSSNRAVVAYKSPETCDIKDSNLFFGSKNADLIKLLVSLIDNDCLKNVTCNAEVSEELENCSIRFLTEIFKIKR